MIILVERFSGIIYNEETLSCGNILVIWYLLIQQIQLV